MTSTSTVAAPTQSNLLKQAKSGKMSLIDLFEAATRLGEANQQKDAIALYRTWLEHNPSPLAYAAWFNLGVLLSNNQDDPGAETCYRNALKQKPNFLEGLLNLGTLLERMKRIEEALDTWRSVLPVADINHEADRKLYLQALNNLGRLLEIEKRLHEAEEYLEISLRTDPTQVNAMTHWVHLRQKQCAWPVYDISKGIPIENMVRGTSALAMLSASGDPELQLVAAKRYVKEKVLKGVPALAPREGYNHQKLRIGYLSSDLHSHAVSILTAEVFELHDRSKVEVFAFSWSREDGTPMRARILKAFDHYIPIATLSDAEAARLIRHHEIDILIDLHGLTLGTRHDILSYRPAPVQITWLGLPGPTGLPAIDYVISDPYVLPPELEPYFTEKPLHMPNCFQSNDRKREIGPTPTRAQAGLPEDKFVFCSFNNSFKLTPEYFDSWMRILKRCPDSVLWLVGDNEWVKTNLVREAEARGMDPNRIIFGGRVSPADYLARYQAADLFLDNAPFNGGTTASDALWAGLPLLTCSGRTFSSRMAGSLLRAVNLPELITTDLQDYEDKAVALYQNRERVEQMKKQLRDNRLTCPLFDTPRFVRDLEEALERVARRPGKRIAGAPAASVPAVGRQRLEDFDALASGAVFAFWLGPYQMSPERTAAMQSIFRDTQRPVIWVTDASVAAWEHPEHPYHPAFPLLSEVHKADYLRCYYMHHYGGGYTDIKPQMSAWHDHFAAFDDPSVLAAGYAEISPTAVAQLPGELGEQLRAHYNEIIGYCAFIFRRRTELTQVWYDRTHALLDQLLPALKAHPAQHPMDQRGVTLPDGKTSQYPLSWTQMGGNIFHPVILEFRQRVAKVPGLQPQLHNYR